MGFLKDLLVEEVPERKSSYEGYSMDESSYNYENETMVDASLEQINPDTLISDIYAENSLSDKVRSIFKVQDVINSLPSEMTTAAKKNTVLSLLGNFGLTITEVAEDGNNRIAILNQVNTNISKECDDLIADYESQIESLKEEIAEKEKLIVDEKDKKTSSNALISAEVETVNKLVKFIEED